MYLRTMKTLKEHVLDKIQRARPRVTREGARHGRLKNNYMSKNV